MGRLVGPGPQLGSNCNPPYSAGQTSQNDGNQNQKYSTLDASIASTYAAQSSATLKNSLYDSYIRAIRWASNRVAGSEHGGMIAYVTNGGYVDSNTADGLRKTLAEEFHAIYIFNLRGNARTSGELRRKEKDNVFGQGSRSTVAIMLLVKKPGPSRGAVIHYRDVGDYRTTAQKLDIVSTTEHVSTDWERIKPNVQGDWINQRNVQFERYTPIAVKAGERAVSVFRLHSGGLKTNRDSWTYNFSREAVAANIGRMIDFYNSQVDSFAEFSARRGVREPQSLVNDFIDVDPTKMSWDRADKNRLPRGIRYNFNKQALVPATYRPFTRERLYFDRQLNNTIYQLPKIFPSAKVHNIGIYVVGAGSAVPFSVLCTDAIPDLHLTGAGSGGQFFPRYTYETATGVTDLFSDADEAEYTRADNITHGILADYQRSYGATVSKDEVFYYVYGLLHSPDYRAEFAADLRKALPRIPKVARVADFIAFAEAGRELASLHIGYESVVPYPLQEIVNPTLGSEDKLYRVQKLVFRKSGNGVDKSSVVYNANITVTGIPTEAYGYMLGSRSAIEWIMERYQVGTDKASGIVNDPNDWADETGDPRYILDLLKRIVTVSVETVRIVGGLPALRVATGE